MSTSPAKIAKAVKYVAFAKKNPNDAHDVNFYLGEGEKITQAELTNYHACVAQNGLPPADLLEVKSEEPEAEAWLTEDTTAPQEPAEPISTAQNCAVEDAAPADEIAQEAPEAEAPTLSITEAKSKLLESQILFRGATDQQRICRARLGRAIAGWQQALGVIVTPTDNVRAHLAHEAEQRRLRAEGLLPARGGRARPGPSAIDGIASATSGATYGNRGGAFAYKRGLIDGTGTMPGQRAASLAQSQVTLNRVAAARAEAARKALPSER